MVHSKKPRAKSLLYILYLLHLYTFICFIPEPAS